MTAYNARIMATEPSTWPTIPTLMLPFSIMYRFVWLMAYYTRAILFIIALHTIDTGYFLMNCILPFDPNDSIVPPTFSPAYPPPFGEYPFAFMICKLAHIMGPKRCPEWIWAYAHYAGWGHKSRGWGHAVAPVQGDSRSPCPAMFVIPSPRPSLQLTNSRGPNFCSRNSNAMANHGILPRDGRHITPAVLSAAVYRSFHLSPTLAVQLLAAFEPFFRGRGWFDLEDLGGQNIIQHDGSLLREDICSPAALASFSGPIECQATPSIPLINKYFPETLKRHYTYVDFARILAHRRWTSWQTTGTWNLSLTQYVFSSGNMALIHQCMGGSMEIIRPWVGSDGFEQFPAKYVPNCPQYWGMSILQLQIWTFLIEVTCGPLSSKRMVGAMNDIDANGGPVFGDIDAQPVQPAQPQPNVQPQPQNPKGQNWMSPPLTQDNPPTTGTGIESNVKSAAGGKGGWSKKSN